MKKYRGLIILDGDETLWSFKWHELIWASVLEPPLRRVSRDEIVDGNGVVLYLRPGSRFFLEKSQKDGFLISMASHNDWVPNVKAILELLDLQRFFYNPQVDWRSKDLQIASILEMLEKDGMKIPQDHVFFFDDRESNINVVKSRYPWINCFLIQPDTYLHPHVSEWIKNVIMTRE